jgi:hypothetical protein
VSPAQRRRRPAVHNPQTVCKRSGRRRRRDLALAALLRLWLGGLITKGTAVGLTSLLQLFGSEVVGLSATDCKHCTQGNALSQFLSFKINKCR